MSSVISMKALLESGVHFGHRTNKWNPLMRPYIFTERNGIHIIDLQQTVKLLNVAFNLVRDTVAKGGIVMFVGTKRQAQETIAEEATRCGMPYVTERWLGGMLTNWTTMMIRIQELERLEKMTESGEINRLTKKEGLLIGRSIKKLTTRLSGVRHLKRVPDLVFIIDTVREHTAVHEANIKNIPVVALVDTNCDPRVVDYAIPSNDDAIRAIKLLVGKIADAVIEGKTMFKDEDQDDLAGGDSSQARPVSSTPRPRMDEESDMDDTDLLGAATLAKLSGKVEEVEAVAEVVEEVVADKPITKAKNAKEVAEEVVEEVVVDKPIAKAKKVKEVAEEVMEEDDDAKPSKKARKTKEVVEELAEEIAEETTEDTTENVA